jgi:putative ABC transport system ATP-binding protein
MLALELEGVVKHYAGSRERVRAIDGVSLQIAAGEMVALKGPSGSGKTTLLLLIAGLVRLDAGEIRAFGRDVAAFSEVERSDYLQREVGFVYQNFHLMPRVKVVENAAVKLMLSGIGMRNAQARVVPWLERLGLSDRLAHTPEQLSGGERQRVAIARAIAGEPKLILADEPTGSLDTARSREVIELLRDVAHERGVAIVLATHDEEAARVADRAVVLRDGQLNGGPPAPLPPRHVEITSG